MGTNWKDIVATVAPTPAPALGGPLAGVAMGAIISAFSPSDATEEKVSAAISAANMDDLLRRRAFRRGASGWQAVATDRHMAFAPTRYKW